MKALALFLFAASAMGQVSLGTGVQIGGSGTSNPLDVGNIAATGEVVSTYQQELFVASNSTITVADIKNVSGTVVAFSLGYCPGTTTCSGAGNSLVSAVKIYYDGNTGTPDMNFNIGDMGANWQQSNTTFQSQRIQTGVASVVSGQGNLEFNYPMYFSTEWRMTITAPSSLTNGETLWLTVWYTTGNTSSLRLHNTSTVGASVNLSTTPYTFMTLSGSGIIAGFVLSVVPGSISDFTYMEANVQTYLDGSSSIGQAIPAGGSSGTTCSVGDILNVVQGGASSGQVKILAVSSGAATALTPVIGNQGTLYSTAAGLATTASSSTCTVLPTIYISTASNSNDSMESYVYQSLEFGITNTRQAPWGFVSAYAPSGNTHGLTVFYDILDQQKGNRFTSGAVVKWEADPIKATRISNAAVSFNYSFLYYQ